MYEQSALVVTIKRGIRIVTAVKSTEASKIAPPTYRKIAKMRNLPLRMISGLSDLKEEKEIKEPKTKKIIKLIRI